MQIKREQKFHDIALDPLCLFYKLDHADYESELKNILSRPVFL